MNKFLHSIHIFICIVHRWMSWTFGIINRGHTALQIGKSLTNMFFLLSALQNILFNILNVSLEVFPSLKQNLT
jgi:hypothetical protein